MVRTCVLGCALAGVLGMAVGCDKSKNTPTTPVVKKDEAVAAYKAKLVDLDKQVADLKAKAEKATGEENAKLAAKHKEAADKVAAAKKKLEELEKAATDKWDAANKETEAAFEEAKKAVS